MPPVLGGHGTTFSTALSLMVGLNILVCPMSRAASRDPWRQFLQSFDGQYCEEKSEEGSLPHRQIGPMVLEEQGDRATRLTLREFKTKLGYPTFLIQNSLLLQY